MPRYFTLQQAERILPHVENAVRTAIDYKREYQEADEAMRELTRKVTMTGGMSVNADSALQLRTQRETNAKRLQQAMDSIQEFGCLVKDLDIGLLDFLTLYRGREVCLCWRLGESKIEHWHGVDEGFRGRKPIDEDFLQNHCGDAET